MALDDIIAASKKSKSGRKVGGFRSDGVKKEGGTRSAGTGAGRNYGKFSEKVPSGKWKHDKFQEVSSVARPSSIGERVSASVGGNPNKRVNVNLSNLAASVVSADLEELFEPYEPELVTVHFNEHGESLGTGSVHLKKKDALKAINDFNGVSLDGQLLKMVILDGTTAVAGTGGIKSRLQFTKQQPVARQPSGFRVASRGGIQKRNRDRPERKSAAHFLDRMGEDDRQPKGRASGRVAAGGRGQRREKKAPKTEAELDAELDAYMNKGKPMEQ